MKGHLCFSDSDIIDIINIEISAGYLKQPEIIIGCLFQVSLLALLSAFAKKINSNRS